MSNKDALLREQQELLEQLALLKKEQELKDKLASIRKQLDTNGFQSEGATMVRTKFSKKEKKETAQAEGSPKGTLIWDDYIIKILEILGGKHKTPEVIQYASKANPDIPKKTIENAITSKLSKLFLEKKIGAEITVRSKGYDYYALPTIKSNLFGN